MLGERKVGRRSGPAAPSHPARFVKLAFRRVPRLKAIVVRAVDVAVESGRRVLSSAAPLAPFALKLAWAKVEVAWARRTGRDSRHDPGQLLLSLEPSAIARLAPRLERGSVVISATNGKTTTAALTAAILRRAGMAPVHNERGDNLLGGVATRLAVAARRGGRIDGDIGVFEVDEGYLARVLPQLAPRVVLLGNVFRDQLDRFGETAAIIDAWRELIGARSRGTRFVLNADDPLVAGLGSDVPGCLYYGIEDPSCALAAPDHAFDGWQCHRCGARYRFAAHFLSHLGHYACPGCGWARPKPDVSAHAVDLDGLRGAHLRLSTPRGDRDLRLRLTGLHNVYNTLAAAAIGYTCGVDLDEVAASLRETPPVWGRGEHFQIGAREVTVTLVKNPAGANTVLRTLTGDGAELDLLGVLTDDGRDGRDVAWVWDADFERLAQHTRSIVCSGSRGAELAVRLKYAGVPAGRIVVDPDIETAVRSAVAQGDGQLHAFANYTGMVALRGALAGARRSVAAAAHGVGC